MGNAGLLLIRLAFGIHSAYYSFNKLFSGSGTWEAVGFTLAPLGITFLPAVWGFILLAIQFFGGIFFALGMLFRGSSFLLFFRCLLYLIIAFITDSGIDAMFTWILHGSVFLGVLLLGEGRYALARWIR